MKNSKLYEVRPIKDLKDMLNSSAEIYGDKAAFYQNQRANPNIFPYHINSINPM